MTSSHYTEDDLDYRGSASDYVEDYDYDADSGYADVVEFAHSCSVDGWVYEGQLNGGDQFSWTGQVTWQGTGTVRTTAKLHLHNDGTGLCDWGGLWIDGWPGAGISINGQAPGARDRLAYAVQDWLTQNGFTLATH